MIPISGCTWYCFSWYYSEDEWLQSGIQHKNTYNSGYCSIRENIDNFEDVSFKTLYEGNGATK